MPFFGIERLSSNPLILSSIQLVISQYLHWKKSCMMMHFDGIISTLRVGSKTSIKLQHFFQNYFQRPPVFLEPFSKVKSLGVLIFSLGSDSVDVFTIKFCFYLLHTCRAFYRLLYSRQGSINRDTHCKEVRIGKTI